MWLAVCANSQCKWEHVASSRISAILYIEAHHLDTLGGWSHRVIAVEIPDTPPSQPQDAQRQLDGLDLT